MMGPETHPVSRSVDKEVDEVEQLITKMNDKLSFLGAENSVHTNVNVSYASSQLKKKSISDSLSRASGPGFNDYDGSISPLNVRNSGKKLTSSSPYGGQSRRSGKSPAVPGGAR